MGLSKQITNKISSDSIMAKWNNLKIDEEIWKKVSPTKEVHQIWGDICIGKHPPKCPMLQIFNLILIIKLLISNNFQQFILFQYQSMQRQPTKPKMHNYFFPHQSKLYSQQMGSRFPASKSPIKDFQLSEENGQQEWRNFEQKQVIFPSAQRHTKEEERKEERKGNRQFNLKITNIDKINSSITGLFDILKKPKKYREDRSQLILQKSPSLHLTSNYSNHQNQRSKQEQGFFQQSLRTREVQNSPNSKLRKQQKFYQPKSRLKENTYARKQGLRINNMDMMRSKQSEVYKRSNYLQQKRDYQVYQNDLARQGILKEKNRQTLSQRTFDYYQKDKIPHKRIQIQNKRKLYENRSALLTNYDQIQRRNIGQGIQRRNHHDMLHAKSVVRNKEHLSPLKKQFKINIVPVENTELPKRFEIPARQGIKKKIAEVLSEQINLDKKLRLSKAEFQNIKGTGKWNELKQILSQNGFNFSDRDLQVQFSIEDSELDPFICDNWEGKNIVKNLAKCFIDSVCFWEHKVHQICSKTQIKEGIFDVNEIDLEKRGYLTIQDLACFINLYSDNFFRNRDLMCFMKRFGNNDKGKRISYEDFMKRITL